jgi:peptide/nickel transport system substrate-binding protein
MLIAKMQKTVDRKKLAKLWQRIFAAIVHDNPYLFLYIPDDITVVNRKVQNVKSSPSGIWYNYIKWQKKDTTIQGE